MRHIAKALAAQGRTFAGGKDTELVHMTKPEVAALNVMAQQHGIAGLTRNPKTGLPEAGVLSAVLGVVGGYFGGPWGAGAGAAIGSKLDGSSDKQALETGALGVGLGYGAAALSGAPIGAGTPNAAPAVDATTVDAQAAGKAAELSGGTPQAATATPQAAPVENAQINTPSGAQPAAPVENAQFNLKGNPVDPYASSRDIARINAPEAAQPGLLQSIKNNPIPYGYGAMALNTALNQPAQQTYTPTMHHDKYQTATMNRRARTAADGPAKAGESPYFVYGTGPGNQDLYSYQDKTLDRTYAQGGQVRGFAAGGYADPSFVGIDTIPTANRPAIDTGGAPGTPGAAYTPTAAWKDPHAGMVPAGYNADGSQIWVSLADPTALGQAFKATSSGQNYDKQLGIRKAGDAAAADAAAQQEEYDRQNNKGVLSHWGGSIANTWEHANDVLPGKRSEINALQDSINDPSKFLTDTIQHGNPVLNDVGTSIGKVFGWAKGGQISSGGISALNPHYLKGPGDGMSDSISAEIQGTHKRPSEPIKVADGEYIVPADAVAHLGNGSSDAGARKMDQMVAKVRTARTGKKKQAPAIKADKYLPT